MDALDKFFKNKMDQRSVPFDEAHWQAAEQLLNEKDKRKRRVLLWWWIGGGTSVGVGLLLAAFVYWDIPGGSPAKYEEQITQLSEIQSEHLSNTTEKTHSSSAIEHADAVTTIDEENFLPKINSGQEIIIPINSLKEEDRASTILNNKKEDESYEHTTAEPHNQLDVEQTSKTTGVENNNEPAKAMSNESTSPDSSRETKVMEIQKPLVMAFTPLEPIPSLLKELDYSREDATEKEAVVAEEIRVKRIRKMYWTLSAATVLNPSDGKSFLGAHMSATAYKAISERTKIHMQLGYQWQNGTFGISQESTQSVYGFGLSVQRYQLAPSRLHYLTGSFGLSRSFRKHELSAGIAYQYLLGLQGQLTNAEKTPFTSIFNQSETATTAWLEEGGYRKHLFGATLAYQYRLVGPLDLMAQFYYWPGLLTDDTPELPDETRLQEAGPVFIDVGIRIRLFD